MASRQGKGTKAKHRAAPVPSPQRVRFEYFNPRAETVNIAGAFNDWRPGATWMIALDKGRWVKDLMLPPGRHEYCLVVDGHWMTDPDDSPYVRVEVFCQDDQVIEVKHMLQTAARTGSNGDGKIQVTDLSEAIRIQTTEHEEVAV